MKKVLSLIIAIATILLTNGCSNKESQAQVLLLEAVSYSTGFPDVRSGEAAVKLANAHGFTGAGQLTRPELILIAGRIQCTEIVERYPQTQAAMKAAELRNEINAKLNTIAQARIRASFE